MYNCGMQITRLTFNEYPLLLRQIHNPPKFLDIAGAPIPSDDHKFLCVVGARQYTKYGEDVCRYLIKGLRGYPIVIVSGLAIGIDSIAHEQALASGLHTISIPGSGLDESSIYPASHFNLAQRIIDSGNTLLSPFEPAQHSTLWTFPARNRVMAGMSHATLVIEGRVGSGTLITAQHAVEFNRDVMIVPGSIFSETSYGPHTLHLDGAIPVANPREILVTLGLEKPEAPPKPKKKRPWYNLMKSRSAVTDNITEITNSLPIISTSPSIDANHNLERLDLLPEEELLLTILRDSSQTNSELVEKSNLSPVKLSIILSQLELKELIENYNGVIKIKRW